MEDLKLDFSKDFLANNYLKGQKFALNFVPNYLPEDALKVFYLLWDRIQTRLDVFEAALLTIFNNQTEDEKEESHTKYKNFQGFNKSEAKYLSLMGEALTNRELTVLEIATCLPNMRKYVVQLMIDPEFMQTIGMLGEYQEYIIPNLHKIEVIRRNG